MTMLDVGMGVFFGGGIMFTIVIVWDIFMKKMYPLRTPIAMQRGDNIVWDMDERAKYNRNKEGYQVLRLRKRKHNIKPPKFKDIMIEKGGRAVFPLFNTTIGQYFPINLPKSNKPTFDVVEDTGSKNWAILELSRVRSTYIEKTSMLQAIAPYLMNGIFAAMIIFFVIYFAGKMEIVSNSLAGASNTLSNAITTWQSAPAPPPPA